MYEWLISKLGFRVQNNMVLLKWEVNPDGSLGFITVPLDQMLEILYGTFDNEGNLIAVNIPETGSYENLIAGDPDGVKGYKPIFEQWRAEGLI